MRESRGRTDTTRWTMGRTRRTTGRDRAACAGLGATVLLLAGAAAVAGQQCEGGRTPVPSIGVGTFHCQGGSCLIGGASSTIRSGLPEPLRAVRDRYETPWAFTVEPSLWEIDPTGPAAGRILEGDKLVAVGGYLVTTSAAWRAMSTAVPGDTLTVTVRRSGGMGTVRAGLEPAGRSLLPEARSVREADTLVELDLPLVGVCGGLRASAGPGDRPWTLENRPVPEPPVIPEGAGVVEVPSLGLTLLGEKQVTVGPDGSVVWSFVEPPTVASVVPGGVAAQAGIRPGERIVGVDGQRLDTPEGIEEFLDAVRGERSILNVWVGRSARGVTLGGGA